MEYGNISQLSAGNLYGAQRGAVTEPYVAREPLAFGKCAFGYVGDGDNAVAIHDDKVVITYSADFTASNATAIDVTINGKVMGTIAFNTSHDITMADLVVAVQALDGAWKVSATGRILTVVTPGETASGSTVVTGSSAPTGTPVVSQSADLVVLGPVLKAQKAPTAVAGSDEGYVENETLEVLVEGYITVQVDDIANVIINTPVYVIKTGSDAGKFTGTSGGNLALNASFHFIADGAQNLAVIRINNMKEAVS
ncbi:hypothetical protein DRJ25_05255 [Candidatus Woesearchaeota archaeon]|nr:MAG: hypothetical protein DRJ25_05255 [Candidatus Woesearchaeota archaeon]